MNYNNTMQCENGCVQTTFITLFNKLYCERCWQQKRIGKPVPKKQKPCQTK